MNTTPQPHEFRIPLRLQVGIRCVIFWLMKRVFPLQLIVRMSILARCMYPQQKPKFLRQNLNLEPSNLHPTTLNLTPKTDVGAPRPLARIHSRVLQAQGRTPNPAP